jgi:Fe-S cluster assembly protein SufD
MTLQTEAPSNEARIIESFEAGIGKDDAGSNISAVRSLSIKRFGELGFPKRKHEMFTYVDTRELVEARYDAQAEPLAQDAADVLKNSFLPCCERSVIVLVDGKFQPSMSNMAGVVEDVTVTTLNDAVLSGRIYEKLSGFASGETDVFATLNGAFASGGVVVRIKPGARPVAPLQIVVFGNARDGREVTAVTPRVVVDAGESSEATVNIKYVGSDGMYFVNAREDVLLAKGAALNYSVIQADGAKALNTAKLTVELGENSRLNHIIALNGGKLVRRNIEARLKGSGAKIEINGASALAGREQAHVYVRVYHDTPGCESSQLFRNVVTGESKASVDTTVIVAEGASGSVSRQLVNSLVLSNGSRADAKPNLMIYNDDVKCSHGATAGGVNEGQLFYMTTRGISRPVAEKALVAAFLRTVTSLLPAPSLVEAAEGLILGKAEIMK